MRLSGDKLTKGWVESTLGDIGKISMCKRVLKKQTSPTGDIPFYKIGTFGKEANAFITDEIYQHFKEKYSFPKQGDILISASGTIGRRVIYDGKPAYFQDSNIVWINNDEKAVLNEYLYMFYGACDWNPSKGATIARLYNDDLRRIKIQFPISLEEQKRIVALLDTVFADLEQTRAKTEQNLKNARELFDSYLQQVFSQKGDGWEVKPLDSFSKIVNGHAFKSGYFSPNNSVKSIKITNVGVYEFVEESDNYLPEDYCDKYSQYKAYEGDIVVALTRTIISKGLKVAVVPASYNGALINQRVAAIHVDEEIMPKELLQAFLSTKTAIDYVKSNVSELMQPNLSIKDLKVFPVPVPPKDKKESVQNELAVILKQKDKLIDIYNHKLASIDELKKSILQKAFSGELTTDKNIGSS